MHYRFINDEEGLGRLQVPDGKRPDFDCCPSCLVLIHEEAVLVDGVNITLPLRLSDVLSDEGGVWKY
jgi:hypothetical protein